jgi:hypothetical protein
LASHQCVKCKDPKALTDLVKQPPHVAARRRLSWHPVGTSRDPGVIHLAGSKMRSSGNQLDRTARDSVLLFSMMPAWGGTRPVVAGLDYLAGLGTPVAAVGFGREQPTPVPYRPRRRPGSLPTRCWRRRIRTLGTA